jgi:hypothetical protein
LNLNIPVLEKRLKFVPTARGPTESVFPCSQSCMHDVTIGTITRIMTQAKTGKYRKKLLIMV